MDETPMQVIDDVNTLSTSESGWRVKLYELESSGSWVDRGVGHVRIDLLPSLHPQADQSHVPSLCIVSEDNGTYLLQSKIQSDDLYEKQGETMILWKEADCSTTIDYAMSFQQPQGCTEIWSEINKVQGEYAQQREYGFTPSFSRTQRIGSQNDDSRTLTDESDVMQSNVYIILPPDVNDESALPAIKHKLDTLHPSQRDYVSSQLLCEESAYLKKLFNIFNMLEETQRILELQMMAEIFRSIFLLNDPNIIEYLLMDDSVFRAVSGIFEYDRTLKVRGQYRHFLFNVARMTFVVSLAPEIQLTCKFLYRLKYVRDIMLHPTIDDPGVSAINSMITFTSVDICNQVMNEKSYIAELFYAISPKFKHCALPANATNVAESRRAIHGVLFLRELFMLSKFLQPDRRYDLYRTFFDEFRSIFGEVFIYLLSGICLGLRSESFKSVSAADNEMPGNNEFSLENFRQRFTYDEAISASVAIAEILSTISFVYPSAIRQIILDVAIHPPVQATKPDSSHGAQSFQAKDDHWSQRSLLYLIIDLIVNNVESSSIDFLGETMKNLLDFDKFNPSNGLMSPGNNNNNNNGNVFQGRSALGGGNSSPTSNIGNLWSGGNKHEKENFLKEFYDHYLYWLLVPFIDIHSHPSQPILTSFYSTRGVHFHHQPEQTRSFVPQTSLALNTSRRIILDVLMICLSCHSYRIKYFLLHGNYIATLINKCFPDGNVNNSQLQRKKKLATSTGVSSSGIEVGGDISSSSSSSSISTLPTQYHPQRTLQLYAVKVLKSILQAKDEFYIKHIIKQDIFKSLFHSFQYYCHRDNIITSAIHDLMEYIRSESHLGLICYLVEKYDSLCFDKVQHVEVFDKLRIKYEQLMDRHRDDRSLLTTSSTSSAHITNENTDYYSVSMASSSGIGDGTHGGLVRTSATMRGTKRQYHSTVINNENRKLKELEDDEMYLNQDDDEDEVGSHPSHIKEIDDQEDSSSIGSDLKRQRSFPSIPYAKPRSPPHYNRKHGTDLDGESIISSGSGGGSHSNSPSSPTLGDAMSIISQYDDDDDDVEENNGNLSSSSLSTLVDSIYDEEDLMITRSSSEGDSFSAVTTEVDVAISSSSAVVIGTTLSGPLEAVSVEPSIVAEEEDESFFANLPPMRRHDDVDEEADEQSFLSAGINKAGLFRTSNSVSSSTTFSGLFKKKQQPQIKFNIDQKS